MLTVKGKAVAQQGTKAVSFLPETCSLWSGCGCALEEANVLTAVPIFEPCCTAQLAWEGV